MIRTYTYTAKLNKSGHQKLDEFFRLNTQLYNAALQERIGAHEKGVKITLANQQASPTEIRNSLPEFGHFHAHSQQSILRRLDKAYRRFFKLGGYPRFKGRIRGIGSFESQLLRVNRNGKYNVVNVRGVGKIRFRGEMPDNVRLVRIVRTALRVVVQLIAEHTDPFIRDSRKPVGTDVGISKLMTLSDGTRIDGRKLDRSELKRKQRLLSRSVKGSNNRKKKRVSLAKEWQRATERTRHENHELTDSLVKDVSGRFVVEDLKIPNMVKNHHLARSISEQNWGDFMQKLTYKAESAGGRVMRVDPKYTSQNCSSCGTERSNISSEYSMFECSSCEIKLDRDVNASKNILRRGVENSPPGWEKDHLNGLPACGKNVGIQNNQALA